MTLHVLGTDRPFLVDLYSCAGGAGRGYHDAGFDVVGVDLDPQPNYPFAFFQRDALDVLREIVETGRFAGRVVDALHGSPPCQAYTSLSVRHRGKGGVADSHPELIGPTRDLMIASGLPWAIENVSGAKRALRNPIRLTGEMFGLGVHRPRLFESNVAIPQPAIPPRQPNPIAVYGKMDGRLLWRRTDGTELRAPRDLVEPSAAMGIDWMTWDELRESIPPAYAHFVGLHLRAAVMTTKRVRREAA